MKIVYYEFCFFVCHYFFFFFRLVPFIFYNPVTEGYPAIHTVHTYMSTPKNNALSDSLDPVIHICLVKKKIQEGCSFRSKRLSNICWYIYTVKISPVVPTKNDSDIVPCLQLLSKTLTCTLHLSYCESLDHLCINPILWIGSIHEWHINPKTLISLQTKHQVTVTPGWQDNVPLLYDFINSVKVMLDKFDNLAFLWQALFFLFLMTHQPLWFICVLWCLNEPFT